MPDKGAKAEESVESSKAAEEDLFKVQRARNWVSPHLRVWLQSSSTSSENWVIGTSARCGWWWRFWWGSSCQGTPCTSSWRHSLGRRLLGTWLWGRISCKTSWYFITGGRQGSFCSVLGVVGWFLLTLISVWILLYFLYLVLVFKPTGYWINN